MTLLAQILVWAIATAGVAALIYRFCILPLRDIKEALQSLAAQESRPVIIRSSIRPLREIAGDIQAISDLLQQQGRQIADESFSLRAILSGMAEGVMIVDAQLRVRLANEALHTMFELSRSPLNRTVLEIFHDHRLQKALEQMLLDGTSQNIEVVSRPAAALSPQKFLRVHASPLHSAGINAPMGAIVVFHDITQLRVLESVRREFVANVSHEFRTPLAIFTGYLETLLDGALDDRDMSERSLRIMQKHAQRMNLLIEDLLTISKMEDRSIPLRLEPTDLRALLDRVTEQLETTIAERGATVDVDFQPHTIESLVDPHRIEQVYFNLLSNALKYGAREQAIITISGRTSDSGVQLVFSDNGPGIPYEDQPHIFERFYRVRKDRSRDAGGTGLGLSIVKNVVQAHGGTVSCTSTPGQGVTFSIHLPREPKPANS